MPARSRTGGRGPAAALAGALIASLAASLTVAPAPLLAQAAAPEAPAAAPEAPPAAPEAPPGARGPADLSARRSAAWVAVGVAAAFATTSAVLALSAESREADIEYLIDLRSAGAGTPSRFSRPVRERYDELVREGEELSFYSWVTMGLAGVAALSAVTLFVLDDPGSARSERPGAHDHSADPGAASARARVSPMLLPGGAGVTLDWEL